nr:MAG TPA_asm: hypothetical protein [Caudoviricetes sp.]DAU44928.1 MAG TPA: hypothetical protein [Caudoviricetes sp.]
MLFICYNDIIPYGVTFVKLFLRNNDNIIVGSICYTCSDIAH